MTSTPCPTCAQTHPQTEGDPIIGCLGGAGGMYRDHVRQSDLYPLPRKPQKAKP